MQVPGLTLEAVALAAPVPIWHAHLTAEEWLKAAAALRQAGGRLLALWAGAAELRDEPMDPARAVEALAAGAPACMCASYATLEGAFWLSVPLA